MADRQQPSELIWEIDTDSQVFKDIRDFNAVDGDEFVLEVFDPDEESNWSIVDQSMLRLRLIRADS